MQSACELWVLTACLRSQRPPSPHVLQLRVLDGGRSAQIVLRGGAELKFAVEYGVSPPSTTWHCE